MIYVKVMPAPVGVIWEAWSDKYPRLISQAKTELKALEALKVLLTEKA